MRVDKLYVNDQEIDLDGVKAFPLNYSIADAKEPQSRKRNYSKNITLKGTRRNLQFFYSAYALSLSTIDNTSLAGFTFDPTIRTPARYYKDGNLVFNGLFQLTKVTRDKKGNYTFDCTLFSNVIEVVLALKDLKVSELPGWDRYNHPLTEDNIVNSWTTSVLVDGVATSNFTGTPEPIGFGYLYGLADYGYPATSPERFTYSDIVPLFYVREAFLKCLEVSNIKVISDFIDSQRFRNLTFGFGGGEKIGLSPTEITNRLVDVYGGYGILYDISTTGVQGDDQAAQWNNTVTLNLLYGGEFTGTVVSDLFNQYNVFNGSILVKKTGNYNLQLGGSFELETFPSLGSPGIYMTPANSKAKFVIKRNGAVIGSEPFDWTNNPALPENIITTALSQNIAAVQGDVITIELVFQSQGQTAATIQNFEVAIGSSDFSFTLKSTDTQLADGDTVEVARFIPDMKANEFFQTVFTAFNLYCSDPDQNGFVTMEPLAKFYKPQTEYDDWSDLVDYKKQQVILPASTIEGKVYAFRFQDDGDYYNMDYKNRYGIGYGNREYTVPSTYQTGEKVFQLAFAQSIPSDGRAGLIIPRIISVDPITNTFKPFKGKARIYFYNGMKAGAWKLCSIGTSTFLSLPYYPSIHHYDNFEDPTMDLNFMSPELLYYTPIAETDNNLFTEYIETFIREITGRDSKILELFIRLKSADIAALDFSRLKMIEGVLYRLNQISDWDSSITESTLTELLKVV